VGDHPLVIGEKIGRRKQAAQKGRDFREFTLPLSAGDIPVGFSTTWNLRYFR
jgi:hypothetical protein